MERAMKIRIKQLLDFIALDGIRKCKKPFSIPLDYEEVVNDIEKVYNLKPHVMKILMAHFIQRFGTETTAIELHVLLVEAIEEWLHDTEKADIWRNWNYEGKKRLISK